MKTGGIQVAGISISHPDRLIYPRLGVTKQDLAEYYAKFANWILPHVVGRPLTLVHCPGGADAPCRYLRHAKAWGPPALRRVRIQEQQKVGEYLVVNDVAGLVSLAQMGVVEIHTWNSTDADVERPNRIVWDLDPGPAVSWRQVVRAATLVRELLHTLGLACWVKTTGGRGLHVVMPLTPSRDWSECLEFARDVSSVIASSDPQRYTTQYARTGRATRILLDYLRNNRTNTTVSAFSPRVTPGATVSTPLGWHELRRSPEHWTLTAVSRRLSRRTVDPWADYWTAKQRLSHTAATAIKRLAS